jgi:TolB-like protein/DNA-binding winged helix-turn-helix (wHTH) protein
MSAPTNAGRRMSTGLFEIDLSSGTVFRQGQRVPVQDQPFRVLALLLDHAGQVVTREDLQARIWPADTYVGFDEGLNTAIRKLRVLFGDSAENPRFIETVPRRGYRFIAPVNELPSICEPAERLYGRVVVQDAAAAAVPVDISGEPQSSGRREPVVAVAGRPARRRAWIWALVTSAAAVIVIIFILETRHNPVPPAPARPAERHERLAVLPFQNLSNDPSQEYFSDGLTEETITDLGQLSPNQLGVIARTSAMAYKHTDKTVGQIGRELNVDYILEGSVRRERGRARISAQLIRVSDQTHLWARSYDVRDLNDLIDVQNAIARAIVDAVQVNVAPQHQEELAEAHLTNPLAYDYYLKGRFYFNQRTQSSILKSIDYFKRATEADPGFALAYAGLAYAYDISDILGARTPKESLPEAKAAATRALGLDPNLAEAYAALGMEKSHFEFDFPGAKAALQKAIELNPNSAYAHFFYSNCYLMPMGLRREALAENKKAIDLDPLSLPFNSFLGNNYILAGDYAAAERQLRHTIEMDPHFALSHGYLMVLYEFEGRFPEAIEEGMKGDQLWGWSETDTKTRADERRKALKNGGENAYLRQRLDEDLSMHKPGAVSGANGLSADYAQVGDKDKAFEWLEKAYEAREGSEITLLAVDPVWNKLHGDPRFSDMLRRMGLPQLDKIEPPLHEN